MMDMLFYRKDIAVTLLLLHCDIFAFFINWLLNFLMNVFDLFPC